MFPVLFLVCNQQVSPEQADDLPGSSLRRPLHVTVQGLGAGGVGGGQKAAGPLQVCVCVCVCGVCVWGGVRAQVCV
jgi:hypothetical protein